MGSSFEQRILTEAAFETWKRNSLVVADMNGDGYLDWFVHYGNGRLALLSRNRNSRIDLSQNWGI